MKAAFIAGTIFVVALWAALAKTVPDIVDEALVQSGQRQLQAVSIPVRGESASGVLVRELQLYSADRAALAAADELRLTIGTYGTTPSLSSAAIAIGPECTFRAAPQTLRENRLLRLLRQPDCKAPDGSGPVTLNLTFNAASAVDARAAIWTVSMDGATPLLLSTDAGSGALGVSGRRMVERTPARASRAQLLAFMWDLSMTKVWVFAIAGALLFVAGGVLASRAGPLASFAATGAIAGGLALGYAIVVPPLQAPDEPDHLLSFAALSQRPDLAAATSAWARRIHFHRMTFSGDERFTPRDREQPFDRDWPPLEVFAEDVAKRSATATRLWQLLAPAVPNTPAHALLLFRLADAAIFAAALATGAALLSSARGGSSSNGVVLVLLLVPTLAFFGMHMSEMAFTLAAFVLTGYTALAMATGGGSRYAGLMLGTATALIAAGPRNGWPALIIVAGLSAARIVSRAISAERAKDAAWFWGGLALPGLILFGTNLLWIPTPFYEQWQLGGFDPRRGVSAVQFMLPLAAGALGGALIELVAASVAPLRAGAALARLLCAAAGAGICVSLVWSIFAPLPQLLGVDSGPAPTAAGYAWSVLRTLATAARVRDFDFLTWTSLWGGFGWINPVLPGFAIAAVTILVSLAAAGTFVSYARREDGRAAAVAAWALAAMLATVAAIAVSSFGLNRNVHGRYLLGACVVGMCLFVSPFLADGTRRIGDGTRSVALYACCCALHGYALSFLLEKYFG